MEKYARQSVADGAKSADDLHVSADCEIYRVLNLHYNRNNHIEVSNWIPNCHPTPATKWRLTECFFLLPLVPVHSMCAGSAELPVRRWADAARVLQVDPGRQGHGTVVEEVDLQDHLATGRPGARVLQVAQLPGAARIGRGSLHAATQHESLFRRRWRLMWTDELLWEGAEGEEDKMLHWYKIFMKDEKMRIHWLDEWPTR